MIASALVCSKDRREVASAVGARVCSIPAQVWNAQARRLLFELKPEGGGITHSRQWTSDWLVRRVGYQALIAEKFEHLG